MSATVEVRGVSMQFGDTRALDGVDLTVEAGETVTLLGPSGCGKTTLLRLIAGLVAPTAGEIRIDGVTPDAARRSKRIGFVPQSPALLPWRTVRANAQLLLDLNRSKSPAAPHRSVDELLAEVGLSDFAGNYPHELSGGMQQRVGLVRAFALDAPLLLMDEPFAALDDMTRTDMRHLLTRIREPIGTTVVFVTHSISEAAYLSDHVVVMSPRPGRVSSVETIPLSHPRRPDMEERQDFFELTTSLRAALRDGSVAS